MSPATSSDPIRDALRHELSLTRYRRLLRLDNEGVVALTTLSALPAYAADIIKNIGRVIRMLARGKGCNMAIDRVPQLVTN
jgi:hypothetical protein